MTFKDYKKAIIKRYFEAKKEDVSGILAEPTPAQLRDFCLMKCDKGISNADEEIMKLFFETRIDETLKRSIDRCNIAKFRPVISFLKQEKDTENKTRVELAAILVDFKPRPYIKFSKTEESSEDVPEEDEALNTFSDKKVKKDRENPEKVPIVVMVNQDANANKNILSFIKSPKKGIAFLTLGGLLLGGSYAAKEVVFPQNECMLWKGNEYELCDCQIKNTTSLYLKPIPYDEIEFQRKKLQVCDTTTFFRNNKPIVWYSKKDNVVEFFNMDGIHPEIPNVELKKISDYMIKQHVMPCKQ